MTDTPHRGWASPLARSQALVRVSGLVFVLLIGLTLWSGLAWLSRTLFHALS